MERVLSRPLERLGRPAWEAFPFLLPAYGLFLLFMVLPVLEALWLSLHREDLFGRGRTWVGLGNYLEVLSRPEFWKSVGLTLKFALIVAPLELLLGLLAALLVYRTYPGVALFRTLFFLTTAVPTAVAAVAWGWFLHPVGGWANRALSALGLPPQPWLTDPGLALPTLAVVTAWAGVGFTAILLTAGLQSIPEEVLEAATVDGAGPWTRFWRVILPLLSPTLFLVGLLVVLKSLTAFGPIHLLTRGGPAEGSMVWIYRVYQDAFFNFQVPLAAAEALLLFLVLLGLAGLQFWLLGRRVHYA
ncbi:MAG: sugar ABC transporter permease [Thermus sp.]|uniref:carbohydrate ABC transporter permease n=1 Tax=unclassified Thermus TaxID=2619321 RepID=UPI000238A118|nr:MULTISPECIES: sugar ABC transporter permease [unclassified Thermus]AEV16195.1 Binding-protein-dependent transport system inner membrane component [Thermus sp. CCB_US3_UF1]MCS6868103.1 sugar ABC transporter permease [Thermus sp.]MCS7218497.1 sugar ABC transporter permease [Thermus sp.]MCX7849921.1 sugar ABC transporter permease [Thermus sp.]